MSLLRRWIVEQYDGVGAAESNPFFFFLVCTLDMPTARIVIEVLFPSGSPAITAWLDKNWEHLQILERLVEETDEVEMAELRAMLNAPPRASFTMPIRHTIDILNHFYKDVAPDVPLLAILRGTKNGIPKEQMDEMVRWAKAKATELRELELLF